MTQFLSFLICKMRIISVSHSLQYVKALRMHTILRRHIFVHNSTIAKGWKQPKCSSAGGWINQMWGIRTMEYYSALKRKEVLTCYMDES